MGGQGEFSPLRCSLFDPFVEKADEDDRLRRSGHPGEEKVAHAQAAPQSNECSATQCRRSTSTLTLKKPIGTRIRRARRKRTKFVTPDLVRIGGQLVRHVASPDNPLSRAEHLRAEYARWRTAILRKRCGSCSVPILSRSSFGDDPSISSAFRPIRSGSSGGSSRGPVDGEVGPLLHHAGDHDERPQTRPQVRCDSGRIDAGQGGDQRGCLTHQGAGWYRRRERGHASANLRVE